MTDKLKPCPFCGGEFITVTYDGEYYYVECNGRDDCNGCDCRGPDNEKADSAIELWNKRDDSIKADAIEEMLEIVRNSTIGNSSGEFAMVHTMAGVDQVLAIMKRHIKELRDK